LFGIGTVGFSISATATDSDIPEWVKNNAKWWSDGTISDADYVTSLQYLITHDVIKVPSSEVTVAQKSIFENHAQSFKVTISNIVKPIPVYYFEKFELTTSGGKGDAFGRIYAFRDAAPSFFLESLPSADKKKFYDFVGDWMDGGSSLNKFDIDVDVLDRTGITVQTWSFKKCEVVSYGTYLQDITNFYQYSGIENSEIRDRTNFLCTGIHLSTP